MCYLMDSFNRMLMVVCYLMDSFNKMLMVVCYSMDSFNRMLSLQFANIFWLDIGSKATFLLALKSRCIKNYND